jgi:LacI family transcriptional regulator, galactose operon repressor
MASTVYDIARAAKVSTTTVLRALWNKDDIKPETRERILRIAAEMNYRPNLAARSLTMGRSHFVGMIVTQYVTSSYADTIGLVIRAVHEAGYVTLCYTTEGHPESERMCIDQLASARVAGAIVIPQADTPNGPVYQELVDSGMKLVVAHSHIEGLSVPQVVGDNYQVAYKPARYLASLGHRDIVYLAIPQDCALGRERARGFRDALAEAGIDAPPSSIVTCGHSEQAGAAATAALLRRRHAPTAIIARHDVVALGVMRAAFDAGVRIPEDLSLVGNSDIQVSELLRVPLTTVRHPAEQVARVASSTLVRMLDGEKPAAEVTRLDVELIERASCGPAARNLG